MEERQMNQPKRFNLWWLLAAAVVMVVVVFNISNADEGHGHHHDDSGDVTIDTVLTGGDNTASNVISGSRSIGIGGSDYDIGQCMYHSGGLTFAIGFRNKFCEGMDMIRSGMVDAGVLHICKQTKIGRNYKTLKDCKDGLAIVYIETPKKDTQGDLSISKPTQDDNEDERIDVLYALFSDLEAQRNEDIAKAEKVAQRANAAAHRANQAEIARKAYAQQLLYELEEWNESED